jgi:hypothetical protein
MKYPIFALSIFFALNAQAGIKDTATKAQQSGKNATERVEFLIDNLENCTVYSSPIISQGLRPGADRLAKANAKFQSGFSKVLAGANSCARPDSNALKSLREIALATTKEIKELENYLKKEHSRLMDATAKTSSWLSSYEDCVMTKKGDPNSTKESLAYQALRRHISEYLGQLDKLAKEIDGAQRGDPDPACAAKKAAANEKAGAVRTIALGRSPAFSPN